MAQSICSMSLALCWADWEIAGNFLFGLSMLPSMDIIHDSINSRGALSRIFFFLSWESTHSIFPLVWVSPPIADPDLSPVVIEFARNKFLDSYFTHTFTGDQPDCSQFLRYCFVQAKTTLLYSLFCATTEDRVRLYQAFSTLLNFFKKGFDDLLVRISEYKTYLPKRYMGGNYGFRSI